MPGRAASDGPGARVGGRPVPAALPGADDRGDRDEGQDDDLLADRRAPGGRPGPPGRARREHRDPDRRATARADARPPRRRRAVRAAAADAVARHDGGGLHERHLGPSRPARVARGATGESSAGWPSWSTRPARSCSTTRTRSSPAYAGPAGVATIRYRRDGRSPGGLGVVDGWIVADDVPRLGARGRRTRRRPVRTAGSCRSTSSRSPAPTTSRTPSPRSRSRSLFGVGRRRHPPGRRRLHAASSTGSSPSRVVDGVRFVNDSQGTQPDAVIAALRAFEPPIVLIAGGRDKGIDLTDARARSSPSGRPPPSSSARAARRSSARSGRPVSPARSVPPASRTPSSGPTRSPATSSRRADDRRRRRTGGSGDGPAQPGRRQLRHVRGLRRPRPGVQGSRRGARRDPSREGGPMNLAPPIPRLERLAPRRRPEDRGSTAPRPTGHRSRAGPAPSAESVTRPTT